MTVKRNNALIFIFITILVDVIGIGVIIPVVPKLIAQLTGEGISEASRYGGWLMFSFAIMQFLFSPIMGGLSDRFGRRPVLLLSLLGLGIDYIFHAYAPTLAWLFVGRLIAGMFGASFTTATAYIADISTPEKRAQNFGLIGAAFGLGFIIGPLIGGLAGGAWGPRAPFLVAAALTICNVVYGFFVLPESLDASQRRPFNWKRANPIGSLMHLRKYPVVSGLVVSLILVYIAAHAVQSNWSYYTMFKFSWDEKMVGYSLAVVGVLVSIVQGGLIRVVIPKLGQQKSIYLGIALYSVGLLLFGMASTTWMMFAFLVPYCLGGIAGPALQGIISSQVPANEQGELQGALTSLMSVTSIIGPVLMNGLFAYFTAKDAPIYLPGAAFYLAAILTVLSLFFAYQTLSTRFVSKH
ncbi:MFS transporter [Bacteroidetes bacterium UKL13-3]|jgi:DHA1 family tetracycline resistance protein-like MFS transporter|nr:MFS transporter [Bacteroidetes bacterium UKL13-3]HCP93560.1 tetracycline resistance MFS efflux pump [Bacteroidota bacterium]